MVGGEKGMKEGIPLTNSHISFSRVVRHGAEWHTSVIRMASLSRSYGRGAIPMTSELAPGLPPPGLWFRPVRHPRFFLLPFESEYSD